jgi:hypothetical protein
MPADRPDVSSVSRIIRAGLPVFVLSVANLCAGEVDRLLVAVNGVVITEGDLDIARSLNAMDSPGKRVDRVSRREEIDRLIDLELMRQELKNFSLDPQDEIQLDAKAKEFRDHLAEVSGITHSLEQVGLTELELHSYLRAAISVLEFVQFRFSPQAYVSEEEIAAYYAERLTPQLREAGVELPPLAKVSADIEKNLKEEKINDALDQWILDTRRNARIEYFNSDGSDVPELENSRESSRPEVRSKMP